MNSRKTAHNLCFRPIKALLVACVLSALFLAHQAQADGYNPVSSLAFEQALKSNSSFNLYSPKHGGGFKVDSSSFIGAASGVNSSQMDAATNQKLYALLVDGRYDFNNENSELSSHSTKSYVLHPYISGGLGMATTGFSNGVTATSGHEVSPLVRLGGGVAYRLGQQWDMSLDYKAGAALMTGDQVFTGRGQQAVDLQSLNLGMRYAF